MAATAPDIAISAKISRNSDISKRYFIDYSSHEATSSHEEVWGNILFGMLASRIWVPVSKMAGDMAITGN